MTWPLVAQKIAKQLLGGSTNWSPATFTTTPRQPRAASVRHGRPRPTASGGVAPQPAGLQEFLTKAGKFMTFIGDFAERVDSRDAALLEEMRATCVTGAPTTCAAWWRWRRSRCLAATTGPSCFGGEH
ncbi:hypothetical protein CC2G_003138 [Coprinopsis cinerea AmutBmut pab1-1]|nr:hypothetical protein CC2G_003138 [Coprinopsis cinerea AmutBmut pab1-1]